MIALERELLAEMYLEEEDAPGRVVKVAMRLPKVGMLTWRGDGGGEPGSAKLCL